MKKFIMFIFILFVGFVLTGCFNDDVVDNDVDENGLMSLKGRVSGFYEGSLSFTLVDFEERYSIFIDGDELIENGDYVRVEGTWLDELDALDTTSVKVLSEDEKREYFKERFVYLEIDVLDFPTVINHTCETPIFDLKLNNMGKESITHEELYSESFPYAVFYFIDGNHSRAHGSVENYDDKKFLNGNRGVLEFSQINPNSSSEVEYWAGGLVTRSEFGTAGSPNIFGNSSAGEIEVKFGWALKNNFDPIFLYITEPITVELLNTNCLF